MKAPRPSQMNEVTIFGRLLNSGKSTMSPRLARFVLTLGFDDEDQSRMRELAERNQLGRLSPEERDELMSFVKASHLLALFHSNARRALAKKKAS